MAEEEKNESLSRIHKLFRLKAYENVDDFVKTYVTEKEKGDENRIFRSLSGVSNLLPRLDSDFEKNGVYYMTLGETIKQVKQKEDMVRITLSTTGINTSTDQPIGGTPDFELIFSLKENNKLNVEKGDVIDFIGYSDDRLVLILKGEPLKVNNLEVNEIQAVKLHKKVNDTSIDNAAKTAKPKL